MSNHAFEPIYFKDKLKIVNPFGFGGVVTLWSRIEYVYEKFKSIGIDLSPITSPIAVFGTLYGNGLRHLLRTLLFNPEIEYLLVCGRNRSGSLEALKNFFEKGVEEVQFLGINAKRVIDTEFILDPLLHPSLFKRTPRIEYVGEPNDLKSLQNAVYSLATVKKSVDTPPPRIRLELPETKVHRFPGNARGQVIIRETPLEAWRELVFRMVRFGHFVHLKKGNRQELQNVKVIIEYPGEDPPEQLKKFGFSIDELKSYQKSILDPNVEKDQAYSYGSRVRSYFGIDALTECIRRLNQDYEDRKSYISLWDTRQDLDDHSGKPCLVSLYFRLFEEKLTLTATFRTHNAMDAWLGNIYGLIAIQDFVCDGAGLPAGPITVFSHSISVDPEVYERARAIYDSKNFELFEDPNGNFKIDVDQHQIIVKHLYKGNILKEYRAKKAEKIQHELVRDCALSDINHALYVGRQLAKAEIALHQGLQFQEE